MRKFLKNIALIALLCCIASPTMAQLGEERNYLSVGANAGVNMAKVSFSPNIKQQNKMGMVGGVTVRYMTEKYFKMLCGVQMEINYSSRGWKELIEDGSENQYERCMNYIEIPLLTHLAFGTDSRTRGAQFFLNLGPQIGFILSESEKGIDDPNWDPSNRPGHIQEQYGKMADKKFDYGITAGAGVEINTKIGHFLLEGRYYMGLGDFYNNSKRDFFGRSAHTIIGIKTTYLFDLGK